MIEQFQWNKNGKQVSLGKNQFTIIELAEKIPLKYGIGTMEILRFDKKEEFSFLNYIFNGLQLCLSVAIDFTLSNKEPSNPSSLHYFDESTNPYLKAITAVGQILENYDSDKLFSVLGFGGRVVNLLDKTSHCFAVNGNIFNPEVYGIQGIIDGMILCVL